MSRLCVIAALLISLVLVGCSQPTQPLQSPAPLPKQGVPRATPRLARVSAEAVRQSPRLSTSIDVSPKVVVIGVQSVITVDISLRNHEKSPVTLTAQLLLTIRAVHSANPREFFTFPRTMSFAPGQTITEQIELPSGLFYEDTYHFSASVMEYGYGSPPAVIRVVRLQ